MALPSSRDPSRDEYFGVLLADDRFRVCLGPRGGYQLQERFGFGDWRAHGLYSSASLLLAHVSAVYCCGAALEALAASLPDDPLSLSAAERRRLRSDPFCFAP